MEDEESREEEEEPAIASCVPVSLGEPTLNSPFNDQKFVVDSRLTSRNRDKEIDREIRFYLRAIVNIILVRRLMNNCIDLLSLTPSPQA